MHHDGMRETMATTLIFGLALWLAAAVLGTDMRVKLGEKTTLPCALLGHSDEQNVVRWYHDERLLTIGSTVVAERTRHRVNKPAPNEWTLVILHTDRSSAGTYTCRLARGTGAQYDVLMAINLFIETRPTIDDLRSTPRSVTVTEGSTCNITCTAAGLPEPTVTWFRVSDTDLEETLISTGVTGSQLIIPTISRYAAGMYTCVAENVHGTDQWDVTITVNFPHQVTVNQSIIQASVSQHVVMMCAVEGEPIHEVYWTDNENRKVDRIPHQVTVNQSIIQASVSQHVVMMCAVEGEPIHEVYWTDNENRKVDRSNWQYEVSIDKLAGYPVTFMTLELRRTAQQHNYGVYTCHAEGPDRDAQATVRLEP